MPITLALGNRERQADSGCLLASQSSFQFSARPCLIGNMVENGDEDGYLMLSSGSGMHVLQVEIPPGITISPNPRLSTLLSPTVTQLAGIVYAGTAQTQREREMVGDLS